MSPGAYLTKEPFEKIFGSRLSGPQQSAEIVGPAYQDGQTAYLHRLRLVASDKPPV